MFVFGRKYIKRIASWPEKTKVWVMDSQVLLINLLESQVGVDKISDCKYKLPWTN